MLISRFLRVCGFVVVRHLPTLDFVSRGLVFVCSRCLQMCVLWWFRADFLIFVGVWFCCFSTSTDVGFCLGLVFVCSRCLKMCVHGGTGRVCCSDI